MGDDGTRWFFGIHGGWLSVDDADEVKDGIRYDEQEILIGGGGFGYKWRFKEHWDLIASLSQAYAEEELTAPMAKRTETSIVVFPGLSFGYTF